MLEGTQVAVIGGNLCWYIFANQRSWNPGVGFKFLLFFSFSLFFSLSLTRRDTRRGGWRFLKLSSKKKQKFQWWHLPSLHSNVTLPVVVTSSSVVVMRTCNVTSCNIMNCSTYNVASLHRCNVMLPSAIAVELTSALLCSVALPSAIIVKLMGAL